MADITVTIEDAQPINVSLGEAVNVYPGGTTDYNDLNNLPDLTLKADKSDTYTKIEVDTSLAGKAEKVHVHTIADVTGLQMALDGKQPVGDYATTSELVEGLNTKQPTGDYATNSSLTAHTSNTANPHSVTKSQLGMSDVPNLDTTAAVANQHTHANKAVLDATTASFTTADETKLSGIATGATANATDAALRARSSHTGTQAISTVTGLQTALDSKQATLVPGTNIKTINGTDLLGSGNITISGGGGGSDELRGTGMPNGVVTASPGTYYTDTNGTNGAWRWLKTSGTASTGWIVTVGDTGKRRIQKDANYSPAMRDIVFQRIGTRVFCEAHYMGALGIFGVPKTGGPYTVYNVPTGFMSPNFAAAPLYDGGTVAQIGIIYQYGQRIGFKVTTASANTDSELSWATADPWPTTLPGTPA